jgi:molybdate transport system ATP-binding protein
MADALTIDIEKRFPAQSIAASLTASLGPGTIVVLFGPSGSGKTTIVRCLAGLERPERGSVQFAGETWFDAAGGVAVPPQQRRVGYVFQDASLFPHLSVRRNVEYGLAELAPAARAARARTMLELVEVADLADRFPRHLSGGQSQRVALARALAPAPRLLLLDEPFAALDTPTRSRMRRLLRESTERLGIGALLVTHDRSEAIALGDQIAVLAEGRIRQVGPVLDVFRRPADLAVARSVGVDSVVAAHVERTADGLIDLLVGDARLRAADVGLEAPTGEVFACIRAEDVTLERLAPAGASARNHLPGRVVTVESEGAVERVTIDCGFPLAALITRNAREEMALHVGAAVVAAVKATAIHLVPRV